MGERGARVVERLQVSGRVKRGRQIDNFGEWNGAKLRDRTPTKRGAEP
jgi:hypothetical protein